MPFGQFKNDLYRLAKETLYEIPGQLVDYFMKKGIHPMPKTVEQRARVQRKLSLKSQTNAPSMQLESYTTRMKNELIEMMIKQGHDPAQV